MTLKLNVAIILIASFACGESTDRPVRTAWPDLTPDVRSLIESFEQTRSASFLSQAIHENNLTPVESTSSAVSNRIALLRSIANYYDDEFDRKTPESISLHAVPPRGYRTGISPTAVIDPEERANYEERIRVLKERSNERAIQRILRDYCDKVSFYADIFEKDNVASVTRLVSNGGIPDNLVIRILIDAGNRQQQACDLDKNSDFRKLQIILVRNRLDYYSGSTATNGMPSRISPDVRKKFKGISRSNSPAAKLKETIGTLLRSGTDVSWSAKIGTYEYGLLCNELGQLLLLDGKNVQLLEVQASLLGAINREVRSAGSQTSPSDLDADSVSRLRNVQYGMSKIWKESFDRYVRWGLLDADEQCRLQKLAAGEPPEADNGDETER